MSHLEWKKFLEKKTWRIDYQMIIYYDYSHCGQRLKWINKETCERKKMNNWLKTMYLKNFRLKSDKCLSKTQIATLKSIWHSKSCAFDFDETMLFIQWIEWRFFSSRTKEQTEIRIETIQILIVKCFWC